MLWFDRLYPAFMLAFPALFTLFVGPREGGDEALARRLRRGLLLATVAALVVHVGVQMVYERRGLPNAALHQVWVVVFPMLGFMLLWFGLAGRVLAARNPGWRNVHEAAGPTRSASLTPRHAPHAEPSPLLVLGWALYAGCVALTGWAVYTSANPLPLLGLMFWPGFVWGARASRLESEPLDRAGSAALAAEYAAFRRFKAAGFVLCGMAGSVVFAGTAVLMVVRPQWAGLAGGFGGAAVGLLGGIFGTLASVRRARINAHLQQLERDTGGS
ncbi:MAG: hypothetical protein DRQ55_06765 [Planctomycetota bacterium]|nr:MAG: hypothetical protein DRQ55_06765 [Planctomycetota bacterium]